MEKSHQRSSGKVITIRRNLRKVIAGVALVFIAATYLAVSLSNQWPGDRFLVPLSLQCSPGHQDIGSRECDSAQTGNPDNQVVETPARDGNMSRGKTGYHDAMVTRQQRNRASGPRAFGDNLASSRALVPGYTLAELCQIDSAVSEYHCTTGSFDGQGGITADRATSGSADGEKISGHVLSSEGLSLNGIRIVASPKRLNDSRVSDSQTLRFWTVTDVLGAYTLDGLPEGEYTIRSGSLGPYLSARIDARTGVTYADLVVSRNLDSVTTGRVLTTLGDPIEGVTVLPVLLGQPSVRTDYDGRFHLQVRLKPTVNAYTVRFQSPGYHEQTAKVLVGTGNVFGDSDLHIVLQPVQAWTAVSGKVSELSGESLANRKVELRSQSARQAYQAETNAAGIFQFPFVEFPATYQLNVFGGTSYKDYQQYVHVSDDMGELEVKLDAYEFGDVSGTLVNADGVPVPDFQLVLRNKASRKANTLVNTDDLGNFDISAVPAGEFVVASQSTPAILVQGLWLDSGENMHLPLVLDWGEHEIRGIVLDNHNNPVAASRVVLEWSYQERGITSRSTRRTATDMQGHFAFDDLGPGPHSLRINAVGYEPVDIDHDLRRQGYNLTVRMK